MSFAETWSARADPGRPFHSIARSRRILQQELAQLKGRAATDVDDPGAPLGRLVAADDRQATRAVFRQLKGRVRDKVAEIEAVLLELDKILSKNSVSRRDLDRLRDLRRELGGLV